eukprot:gene1721-2382_t
MKKEKKEKKEKKSKKERSEKKDKKSKKEKKSSKDQERQLLKEAKRFIKKEAARLQEQASAKLAPAGSQQIVRQDLQGQPVGPVGTAAAAFAAAEEERRAQQESSWQQQRLEQKRHKGDQKEWLDEMLPKATGREAMLEKKAVQRQQAREREASPDIGGLYGGGDIMGGDDSFAAAKARMQHSQGRREQQRQLKNSE